MLLRVGWLVQMLLVTELMQGGDLRSRIRADSASPRRTGWYRDGRYIALAKVLTTTRTAGCLVRFATLCRLLIPASTCSHASGSQQHPMQ